MSTLKYYAILDFGNRTNDSTNFASKGYNAHSLDKVVCHALNLDLLRHARPSTTKPKKRTVFRAQ
jgi:hypothetical protein